MAHELFVLYERKCLLMNKFFLFVPVFFVVFASRVQAGYTLSWPGMLPDHPLYIIKVARNKLIEKMIYSPMKRIEFDLLMADKTLYASRLLMDKGEQKLAAETALKGENFMSILVSDYRTAKGSALLVPKELDQKITEAYVAHQELIAYLIVHAQDPYKEVYKQVDYFSKTNFSTLEGLRLQK